MLRLLERLWSSAREIPAPRIASPGSGYGVWTVSFGASGECADAGGYARRAVLAGDRAVTLWLNIRTSAGDEIRWRSVSGACRFSGRDTEARLIAKANGIAAYFAADARSRSPEDFFRLQRARASRSTSDAAPKETGEGSLGAHLKRLLDELGDDLFKRKQWRLLIGPAGGTTPSPAGLKRIVPPDDRIRADPFVFEEDGRTHVFFEEMEYDERCGRIACGEWKDDALTNVRTALLTGLHLSYPQVFRHAGRLWLTAESAAADGLTAYECVRFPDTWKPGPVIFDRPAIDPSVFEHEGRWWLACNLRAGPGAKADDDLHLFHAGDPLSGKWTPHPLNPVVSDARFARGAGRPFVRDGKLFRPAQDCAGVYGGKVVLREITTLTPEDYAEKSVGEMTPEAIGGAVATHTWNPSSTLVASDFAVMIPRQFRRRKL